MPKADEYENPWQACEQREITEPAERITMGSVIGGENSCCARRWWQVMSRRYENNGDNAPHDQDDYHDRGDLHDAQCFLAGLVNALNVLPPEIHHDPDGKYDGEVVATNACE